MAWEPKYSPKDPVLWKMGPPRRRPVPAQDASVHEKSESGTDEAAEGRVQSQLEAGSRASSSRTRAASLGSLDIDTPLKLCCSEGSLPASPPASPYAKLSKSYKALLGDAAPRFARCRPQVRRKVPGAMSAWDMGGVESLPRRGPFRETAVELIPWSAGQAPRPNPKALKLVPGPGYYSEPGCGYGRSTWSPRHGEYPTLGRRALCTASELNITDGRYDIKSPPPYDVNTAYSPS